MKGLYIALAIALTTILSPTGGQTSSITTGSNTTLATTVPRPSVPSVVSIDQAPDQTVERIDPLILRALERFEAAGLDLPDLTFVVFDSTIDCDANSGYYFASRRTLHICQLDDKTVLHELAHAWAGHALTDAQKTSFAEFRGADGWNNADDEWKDRATEQAAETIAWALADEERTVKWVLTDGTTTRRLLTIDDSSPDRLAETYRLLTGMDLPPDRLAPPDQPVFDDGPELKRVRG